MAATNSTGVRSHADHLARIAPTYPQTAADKAAHAKASFVRGHAGDSTPDITDALRRVQTEVAYIERDAQLDAAVAADIAAKDDEDDGNWIPEANWIPNAAPAPRRGWTPIEVPEDVWDAVMDGYSYEPAAA